MDDKVQRILTFLKSYSLTIESIKISIRFYVIKLITGNLGINYKSITDNFNVLCRTIGYTEYSIDFKKDYVEILLPVLFDKVMFDKLSVFNWNMEPVDRSIDPTKYTIYINSISDNKLKAVVDGIIQNTIYINFSTFKHYLDALTTTLPVKFNLLLDTEKIGSEHWIIALIWDKIRDKVVKIINTKDNIDNEYPIVIMDDCIYSARHSIGLMGELIIRHNERNYRGTEELIYFSTRDISTVINRTLNNEIIILSVCTSTTGAYYINEFKADVGVRVKMFSGFTLAPAVLLVKDKLENTIYGFMDNEDAVDYFIDHIGAKDTNLAIYFDHKIAGEFSSFPDIYSKIVKASPSRYKIEQLERMLLDFH